MALSNKEKVGRGLTLLADGLRPFVDEHMTDALPAGTPPGTDWVSVLAARDAAKHGTAKTYSTDDPRFLLKVVTEEWRVFSGVLGRPEQALASELRAVGNRWAHDPSISSDDTYRALDTAERLLTAVGAKDQAEAVSKIRLDHQRQVFEDQTRKTVKAASAAVSVPGSQAGTAIKPWRDVIIPHRDVATGQFNAAEFAADLHQVATGQAKAPEYTGPREFFARTYVTGGLAELLERALRRVSGDLNASPVMNLQTQFGGGKTHSMLALYHLFSGITTAQLPQAVQEIVATVFPRAVADDTEPGDDPLAALDVRRVTLVGTHLSPSQPLVKEDGTEVRTLWGELAWQLGGRPAYDRVARADERGVPPGDVLADLVREHAPAVILIDEWVAYARLLVGKEGLPGGDFAAQFTFAQHLTELVRAVPGAMLVVSIPASDTLDAGGGGSALEVGGPNGREALERLQHVVGRTADDWRPASATESFEIVKRRLFEEPDAVARADIAAVARQYAQYYQQSTGQFPRDVTSAEYENRIRVAYPIHPELFDRLYEDWSTLEKFQRTRGVLRLMSIVIHALWSAQDASPLISPGTIPVHDPAVFSELTKYLPDNWKPIVDSDIDGEASTPVKIDTERPSFGSRALTRRIARTVFLGSAPTLGTAHKGLEKPRVWLGVAVPGDTMGHFGDALEILGQRATYLYSESGRYWYDTTASISRQAADRADRLREVPEEVWAEIVRRLNPLARGAHGMFAGVHVAPQDTGDVPDTDEVRLVVVHPSMTYGKETSKARDFAEDLLLHVGNGQRARRNMVVLVAADAQRYDELEAAVREYLAWSSIVRDADALDLRPQQLKQAQGRAAQADDTVTSRISATYTAGLVPQQLDPRAPASVVFERIAEGKGTLPERVSEKLRRGQELAVSYAPINIRMALDGPLSSVWSAGHVEFGRLWDLYSRYPYLDRLRDRRVLEDAVLATRTSLVWTDEGFAIAYGFDADTGAYDRLWLPGDVPEPLSLSDSMLLVRPDRALAQRAAEQVPVDGGLDAGGASGGTSGGDDGGDTGGRAPAPTPGPVGNPPSPGPTPPRRPVQRRFFGAKVLSPERYAGDFAKVTQEVIQHLAAADAVDLEVRIEITATAPDGFTEQQVRTVRENATQLTFDQAGFEES
ncbi:Predicted ATPase, AAA+ superfamily [Cellulosimicrobium cellulans]|nr:Predicted ATPase, AAA+ superfamily [Cellulosimicrobium cellulans]